MFVVEVKASRGIVPFSPIGDGQCPRGRFAKTTHTHFQIVQPGSN